jgi:hypothetical protein
MRNMSAEAESAVSFTFHFSSTLLFLMLICNVVRQAGQTSVAPDFSRKRCHVSSSTHVPLSLPAAGDNALALQRRTSNHNLIKCLLKTAQVEGSSGLKLFCTAADTSALTRRTSHCCDPLRQGNLTACSSPRP